MVEIVGCNTRVIIGVLAFQSYTSSERDSKEFDLRELLTSEDLYGDICKDLFFCTHCVMYFKSLSECILDH